jgi:hypothetical protein
MCYKIRIYPKFETFRTQAFRIIDTELQNCSGADSSRPDNKFLCGIVRLPPVLWRFLPLTDDTLGTSLPLTVFDIPDPVPQFWPALYNTCQFVFRLHFLNLLYGLPVTKALPVTCFYTTWRLAAFYLFHETRVKFPLLSFQSALCLP